MLATNVTVVSLVHEEALEQREHDERPCVADVYAPVHGRSAGVDPDLPGLARAQRQHLAGERVVKRDLAHEREKLAGLRRRRSGLRQRGDGQRRGALEPPDEAHPLAARRLDIQLSSRRRPAPRASRRCIAGRCGSSLGCSITTVASTCSIAQPRSASIATAARSSSIESAPR